jgi:hypothetical protein
LSPRTKLDFFFFAGGKLDDVDQFTASYLGGFCLKNFAQRPATGTGGGILLWVHVTNIVALEFSLSASILNAGPKHLSFVILVE